MLTATDGRTERASTASTCRVDAPFLAALPPAPLPLGGSAALQQAYRLFLRLRERQHSFTCIQLNGSLSAAYYCLLARRQGLAFPKTRFELTGVKPTLWQLERDSAFLDRFDLLEIDAVERRCVKLADAVQVETEDMRQWMVERHWPEPTSPSRADTHTPFVSVCLVHHERPRLLRQALDSLAAQDYSAFEVVLVDDGSTSPEALACLDQLAPQFAARGWTLVRQPNRYLGAARNTAAHHARGEFLLFMDDDNLAKPNEIRTLMLAAQRTQADIVTTFMDFFSGDEPPCPGQSPTCRWLFAGVGSLAGIARNCYGDANALVRRSCFEALGGFTEDYGITHEDWEFFARAALRGFHLEVVPEALFWYRLAPGSMIRTTPAARNYARSLRPFLEDVSGPYRDLLRLAQGQALANELLIARLGSPLGQVAQPLRYRIADWFYSCLKRIPFVAPLLRFLRRRP